MTSVALPPATAVTPRAAHQSRRLRYGWPLDLLFFGFPVWWVLGLQSFAWQIMAVPLAAHLVVDRRRLKVPRGTGIWFLFLGWVAFSAVSLAEPTQLAAFGYRLSLYVAATVVFVFVYNAPRDLLPLRRVWSLCAALWLTTVAGGWLGVLIPSGGFTSAVELVFPGPIGAEPFLYDLVHPSFAQVHDFLGYPLGRPKAPFVYTNHWGSAYALLTAVMILGWNQINGRRYQMGPPLLLVASLVPAIVSLNRGLFLGLGVALVYASTRPGRLGRRGRRALAAMAVPLAVVLLFTPLGNIAADRQENQHSNTGRLRLYNEAVELTAKSPLVGYGAPQEQLGTRIVPAVGTQGQFWLVMVSQGMVGLVLYVAFLISLLRSTRRLPESVAVAHLLLAIVLVQMFVYELTAAPHHILFLVVGVALREAQRPQGDGSEAHPLLAVAP